MNTDHKSSFEDASVVFQNTRAQAIQELAVTIMLPGED